MKITIGGSMSFANEMLKIKKLLEKNRHEVFVSDDTEFYRNAPSAKQNFGQELKKSLECDVMKKFFEKIADSDAFLVCNFDKKNIKGYLGTSVLMEIGLAYYLGKKIYLLNEIDLLQPYALEIEIIHPVVLKGDVGKIK